MALKWYLVLFASFLFQLVKNQGFGDYDDLNPSDVYSGGGDTRKRSPLERQDGRISPQLSLKGRLGSTKSIPFSEALPIGTLHFGNRILSDVQRQRLFSSRWTSDRMMSFDRSMIWNDAVIPYSIDCSLEKLKDAVSSIKAALKEWERKTCIRFVKRKNEERYLRFFRDTSCWVHVGTNKKHSSISVGYGCEKSHIMAHSVGHVIGLYHQHNRKDRDNYVQIRNNRIKEGYQDVFTKVRNSYPKQLNYDHDSVMHYPWAAFSKGTSKTIVQRPSREEGRPFKKISTKDIQQVKAIYNCKAIKQKRQAILMRAQSTVQIRARPRPPGGDEFGLFSAMQSSPGAPGCVDWSNVDDCNSWKRIGYCQTQETVRLYCKKTCDADVCSGLSDDTCNGEDKHPNCRAFKSKFCTHPNYKDWMRENCCQYCRESTKGVTYNKCIDTPGTFCSTYVSKGYCRNSKNFREEMCCKTCEDRNVCRSKQDICGLGTCVNLGGYKFKCTCNVGAVAIDGGKRCVEEKCGGCDKKNGKCVKSGRIYVCQCKRGYQLRNDKKTCADRNECEANRNICGLGKCINVQGSFQCRCNQGATAIDGGKRCVGKTTCNVLPPSSVNPLNPQYPANLGTGRLCRSMRRRRRGDACDKVGLEPQGLCTKPLGLSHGTGRYKIPDTAFKASYGHLVVANAGKQWAARASNARLYMEDNYQKGDIGAWCAASGESSMDRLQYLRVDLGRKKRITHIATQGRDKYFERVSRFKIEYSDTGNDDDFCPYLENGKDKIFEGNCDHVTPVVNQFFEPLVARFIRYIPWKYNYPCVRMELYGCDVGELQPDP